MRKKAHFRDTSNILAIMFAFMVTFHGSRNIYIYIFGHVTKLSIEYQAAYVPFERDQVIS